MSKNHPIIAHRAEVGPRAVGVEPLVERREAAVEQRAALGEEDLVVVLILFLDLCVFMSFEFQRSLLSTTTLGVELWI